MGSKAEERQALAVEIRKVCSDVEEEFRPSVWQFGMFRNLVDWIDGCDPDGYFLGRCALAVGTPHPARYNFIKGVMRCDPDDDRPSCHEANGHTVSLTNVTALRAARG